VKHHHDHIENDPRFHGLSVNKGIEQPPSVSTDAAARFLNRKKSAMGTEAFVEGILNGDITILSRAVTLVESSRPDHQAQARQIIERCLPYAGKSIRLGITGVPGAGKSTFIESLGMHVIGKGHKLAVLAIDPSSEKSKGSILGDKTRMEQLSAQKKAYIRPSPSAGSLGGVARKTRETIVLCEAAGFDTIFIETVGVGQSETAVHSMVDFFLLIMLAGAGDELQGIKRGIMEMADAIAINKADGSNMDRARLAQAEYKNALHLFPPSKSGWEPEVKTCSALHHKGIADIWKMVNDYVTHCKGNGFFDRNRLDQSSYWMFESVNDVLRTNFYHHPLIKKHLAEVLSQVAAETKSSFLAAQELLQMYYENIDRNNYLKTDE
jgi:LAO/AO transport system kinase